LFILWSNRDKKISFALLGVIVILSWFASQVPGALKVLWSPYQKLVVGESLPTGIGDYYISQNNVGYQIIIDLSDDAISAHPEKFQLEWKGLSQYDIPLLLHPNPESFLIVGGGAGNDAAGGLRHDVESITAVEIDPAIIAIGRELHPEKPYLSPNVQVVNDDARSFFATTHEKYDVIAFGLLDSLTSTSMTNARLDNYVYTKESIIQAKSRLNEGGVMVLTFEVERPFIADRINTALEEVFNQPPLVFRIPSNTYGPGGVMFITGDMQNVQKQIDQNPSLAAFIKHLQVLSPVQLK
jgi:hypothetical protein